MAKGQLPSDNFEEEALSLIQTESTLTLATTGDKGPWSAPVYYVFVDGLFYFFSSPESRHIQQALESGQTAASLYHQEDAWQAIRGIQMAGAVKEVRSILVSGKVIACYLKRFPFTRTFFPNDLEPALNAFSKHFRARLYVFSPTDLFYTDNRFGFGTRQGIEMESFKF